MNNESNIHIDFDAIEKQISAVVKEQNDSMLKAGVSPKVIENIDSNAAIAKAVFLTGINAYHQELMKSLRRTSDQ